MPQSATPATQNDVATCLETFKKDTFCNFPHRHGDATRKPETRDETRECRKTSISYETSCNFHNWQHDKRTSFAASPIDMARPQENQRPETRQVGAPKRAFRARLPPILTFSRRYQSGWNVTKCHACHTKRHDNLLGNLQKGDVLQLPPLTRRHHRKTRDPRRDRWEHQNEHFVRDFLQFSHFVASKSTFSSEFSLEPENLQPQNRCFVRGFRQFSAHRTKCHACHGICTLSPLDAALPMRFTK